MSKPMCKRCGSTNHVKHGFIQGRQRYRCRECGYNFTDTPRRGKPASTKAMAGLLYQLGFGYGTIAKLLNVSNVAVYKWVRTDNTMFSGSRRASGARLISMEELARFVETKGKKAGAEKNVLLLQQGLAPGSWAAIMLPAAPEQEKQAEVTQKRPEKTPDPLA